MTPGYWARVDVQRSTAGAILFGICGTLLIVTGLARLRLHWLYWLLAVICVGVIWRNAYTAVRNASGVIAGPDERVSLSALAFQLTLAGASLGVVTGLLPGIRGPLLVASVATAAAWNVAALVAARRFGVAPREPFRPGTKELTARIRELGSGIATKDADPIGCTLSIGALVALGWLALCIWVVVDILSQVVAEVVFLGPRWLASRLLASGGSTGSLALAATFWTMGFAVVVLGVRVASETFAHWY